MPSPPPPYTASPVSAPNSSRNFLASPRTTNSSASQTTSPTNNASEYNTPVSAATSVSSVGYLPFQRSGPSSISVNTGTRHASPTSFPPPPLSQRDRSTSRTSKPFNLSALTSRNKTADSSSSVKSFGVLQHQTNQALASAPIKGAQPINVADPYAIPPTARRAASAGAVGTGIGSYRETSREGGIINEFSWASGQSIPLPPPGPPPGARTQSLSRNYKRLISAPLTESSSSIGLTRRTPGSRRLE